MITPNLNDILETASKLNTNLEGVSRGAEVFFYDDHGRVVSGTVIDIAETKHDLLVIMWQNDEEDLRIVTRSVHVVSSSPTGFGFQDIDCED